MTSFTHSNRDDARINAVGRLYVSATGRYLRLPNDHADMLERTPRSGWLDAARGRVLPEWLLPLIGLIVALGMAGAAAYFGRPS